MIGMDIKQYVKDTRYHGANDEDIRSALKSVGWGEFEINVAFMDADKEASLDENMINSELASQKQLKKDTFRAIIWVVLATVIILIGLVALVYFYPPLRQFLNL